MKRIIKVESSTERDIDAFKGVFDKYYDDIKNFLYFKSGDIEIAEDFTQEAFLKVWENKKNIRKESVQGYLYTIASNLIKNHYKRNAISFNFINSQVNNPVSESPEYILELKEFDKKLQNTLASMPEKSRIAFLMNRIDGFIYEEIAKKLNISVKAVEKRIHKALSHLKKHINYKI